MLSPGIWSPEGRARLLAHLPGVMFSATLAMAAGFISTGYGGPTILFALLLGMAFNFLAGEPRFTPGLAFASRSVLRLGVALLGARITLEQILALGWGTLAAVAAAVALTIGFGVVAAHLAGFRRPFGVLTAGAVAICGASAAAAISAVLPRHPTHERDTAFTIIGVTTLSTVAMVLYPGLAAWLGLTHAATGVFLGGTIHDVAQVVGAAYSVAPEAGDVATVVKLLRVALLVPVVLVLALLFRGAGPDGKAKRPPLVPGFLLGFIGLVTLASLELMPAGLQVLLGDASRWCIVMAIAALGVKTSLVALARVGRRALLLMIAQTAFIACLVLLLIQAGVVSPDLARMRGG